MRVLRYLIVGALVLAATLAAWAALAAGLAYVFHWRNAGVIAAAAIVVAGWAANGLLLWRQSRHGGPKSG